VKFLRDCLGFWPITALILTMVKEFCCAKMPEFCGRKPQKRGNRPFGRLPSFFGSDFSITPGGIRAFEPAITPFKALLEFIAWKRTGGLDSSEILSVATGPSGMIPSDAGEDESMEGDSSSGGGIPENNVNESEHQRGHSANKKRVNPNGDNNNDDDDDDNDPHQNPQFSDDDFDSQARDAEQLKILLRLAQGNRIAGSCTLVSTFQKNEVVLLFVAIKYNHLPEVNPRRGFVLYKIKEEVIIDYNA
jgi:hypothetical protein